MIILAAIGSFTLLVLGLKAAHQLETRTKDMTPAERHSLAETFNQHYLD